TKRKCISFGRSSLLLFCFFSVALCQQRKTTAKKSSDIPTLNYKYVDWPIEATSAAGFPAGPWNFIQVAAVATTARGYILVLHRGAQPIMEFEDRKSTRLNSSHVEISYAVFCLKKKKAKDAQVRIDADHFVIRHAGVG